MFIDLFFRIRRNKRIKKINERARNVKKYKRTRVGKLFPSHTYKDSIIISGGDSDVRLNICEEILLNAYKVSHPVIILHTSDKALENIFIRNEFGIVVNADNKIFDAFTSFDFNEIFRVVTETCKSIYDIKPVVRYILQVAYDLLCNVGKKTYFSSFAACPYFQLSDIITKRLLNNKITQNIADELNSYLSMGQAECPKIDTFFRDMKFQIDYLSAADPARVNAVSVLSAIENKQILCIDLRASTNVMLLELIVNSLIIAMNRGYDFSLMIDDIAFTNNDMLKNTICQKSNHHNIIISKDLYALTGGNENIFSTIIAEAEKTVLFGHSSNISCEKWSKYLGEYDKIEINTSSNHSWGKGGYNSGGGTNEAHKREARVKSNEINCLPKTGAFIYDRKDNSLIQTVIK